MLQRGERRVGPRAARCSSGGVVEPHARRRGGDPRSGCLRGFRSDLAREPGGAVAHEGLGKAAVRADLARGDRMVACSAHETAPVRSVLSIMQASESISPSRFSQPPRPVVRAPSRFGLDQA